MIQNVWIWIYQPQNYFKNFNDFINLQIIIVLITVEHRYSSTSRARHLCRIIFEVTLYRIFTITGSKVFSKNFKTSFLSGMIYKIRLMERVCAEETPLLNPLFYLISASHFPAHSVRYTAEPRKKFVIFSMSSSLHNNFFSKWRQMTNNYSRKYIGTIYKK